MLVEPWLLAKCGRPPWHNPFVLSWVAASLSCVAMGWKACRLCKQTHAPALPTRRLGTRICPDLRHVDPNLILSLGQPVLLCKPTSHDASNSSVLWVTQAAQGPWTRVQGYQGPNSSFIQCTRISTQHNNTRKLWVMEAWKGKSASNRLPGKVGNRGSGKESPWTP